MYSTNSTNRKVTWAVCTYSGQNNTNVTLHSTAVAVHYCMHTQWSIRNTFNFSTLKMIYYSYVHSIMTYGIIFWGNSPHSTHIFKIQKRIIRIMTKSRRRDSCRHLFKRFEILPLKSQYIFSTLLFVAKNKDSFITNQEIHNIIQDVIQIYILQHVTIPKGCSLLWHKTIQSPAAKFSRIFLKQ
jgi:hypothetical protein